MKKKIILLGCTGSIGTTAIQAIRDSKLDVQVVGISAHSNQDSLFNLASELGCNAVCLTGKACPPCTSIRTYSFFSGLSEMLASLEADIVLNAIAGFDGLQASLLSLKHGFDLALANKESVVCAGSFLFDYARENHRSIIPVDSEHSAISELLKKRDLLEVDTLILTGSGGPFRTLPHEQFSSITVEQALNHPTWNMGKKITIDSATLANKALEVIEASYLFSFPANKIEVVIHPQSIVHSMIRLKDGAVYAQLGNPDMTLPIVNALQQDSVNLVKPLDFSMLSLTFEKPDIQRFPLLGLAFTILERKGSSALAFNAADEVAVHAFLDKRCSYQEMIGVVQKTLERKWEQTPSSFTETLALDAEARKLARSFL